MNAKSSTKAFLYRTAAAIVIVMLALVALPVTPAHAAARTASVTGNWSNTATWGGFAAPVAGDTVTINSGITVTIDVALAECASITFNAPAASGGITISGTNVLTVSGDIIMNAATAASTTTLAVGTGTLNAGSITISGANTANFINQVTVSTGTINSTGNLTFNSGTAAASAVLAASATGHTITIGGDLTGAAGNGTLTLANPTSISLGGNYTFAGTMSNTNRLNLTLNGSGTQTVNGTNTFYSLIINKTSGTATLGANVTPNANLTVTAGILDLSTFTCNRGGGGGGSLSVSSGATLKIGGTNGMPTGYTIAHTFDATSTVEFYGTNQTLYDGTTADAFGNLTLSGSGTKTATNETVAGILSIEGTAVPSAALAWSGTAYTLQYKTTDTRTVGAEWTTPFAGTGGVIIANPSGSLTLNAAKVFNVSVPLTINSGATLAMSTFLLTLKG